MSINKDFIIGVSTVHNILYILINVGNKRVKLYPNRNNSILLNLYNIDNNQKSNDLRHNRLCIVRNCIFYKAT